ncbi:MAG TPA: hypothetical protein EYN40_03635 [Planctomycetes bacterium]|nr:hypothetical protein [Planctomycetota bacterium]
MSLFQTFFSRSCGVVLIAGGIAMFFVREQWGQDGLLCLAWGVLWSVGLGVLGFRSMRTILTCDPQKMTVHLLMGVFQRALVLFASMGLVHGLAGAEWSRRALLTTTVLYMFVLAVEVFTLSQALKTGQLARVVQPVQPSDSTINESLAKGNSEEAQKEAGR